MESISTFITTLVITLILMTAVELIAPDNSIKKYINFVLGLILISVMLAPIISFFSKGETKIVSQITRYEKDFKNVAKGEKINEETDDKNRSQLFKENLDKNCNSMLKEEFEGREFESNISCNMDIANMTYTIDKIEIGVKEKGIKKVQKVEINTKDSSEAVASQIEGEVSEEEEIKIYLEQVLNVKAENIKIYNMEE